MQSEAQYHLLEAQSCRQRANRYLGGAIKNLVRIGGLTVLAHETVGRILPDDISDKVIKAGVAATAITTLADVASSTQERVEAFIHEQRAKVLTEEERYVRATEPQVA